MAGRNYTIAIDGPAASGKSSVARQIAADFGFLFVNSGAMYRAFTWHVLEEGVDPGDSEAVVELLRSTTFRCGVENRQSTISVNGVDPGESLMSESVNKAVSRIAAIPEVRTRLVEEQRRYADLGSLVMEGRDIGTVVFPKSRHKFYLDAQSEVRARRRKDQGVQDDIRGRDRVDSTRKTAPLRVAEDARVVDTSYLSLEEVVRKVSQVLRDSGVRPSHPARPVPVRFGTPYWLCYTLSKIYFALLFRPQAHGLAHAEVAGGAFLAANHESFLDPPLIGTRLQEPIYYLARKTLFKGPLFKWLLPRLNAIPVDQEKSDMSSLRESLRVVKEGHKMVIFPEGQRTMDGELQPALRGVGLMIAKSGVPVIPVRVFGAYEAFPRKARFPRLHGKLHVVFGEPLVFSKEELTGLGREGTQEVANRVMAAIAELRVPGDPNA